VLVALGLLGALLWAFVFKPKAEAGKIAVPDLTRRTVAQAEKSAQAVGLKLVVSGKASSDTVPGGQILSQTPPARDKVAKGTEITVVVSQGPRYVTVPNLTGLTPDQAKRQLARNGLMLGRREEAEDPSKPDGKIIGQTPNAGKSVDKGTVVDVFVNKLPKPSPEEKLEETTSTPEGEPGAEEGGGLVDTLKEEAQKKAEEMMDQAVEAGKEKLSEKTEEGKEQMREGWQKVREGITKEGE
jgi:serine/threonine-protein kinase